jgi:DNA-binding LacI/PurR family transcriptional regulator
MGRTVPDDVAIVGFDDIPAASLSSPPLTTVTQDSHHAGEALIEAIIEAVELAATSNRVLPVHLTIRDSSVLRD